MASVRQVLASLETATSAIRWDIVGDLGRIRFRKDTGSYYLDFRPHGRLYRHRGIPITEEQTAQRLLEQIRARVADGYTLGEVLTDYQPEDSNSNRVQAWLDRWLDVKRHESEAGDISPSYLRQIERYADAGGYFSWWEGRNIYEIDYGSLEDWSLWLSKREIGSKTRKNVIGAFRSFVGWLKKRQKLREIPEFPWPKVPEYQPRIITPEQQDAILDAIPRERRGIFLAMALSGIRPGEARALDVADFRDGWLAVTKATKGSRLSDPIRGTKSGKTKRVPVDPELTEWIEDYVDARSRLKQAPLFTNPRTGGRWSPSSLRRTWESACGKVGIGWISIYEGCKHSFATAAHERGVPERNLQAMLGHADARSTRRYAMLQNEALVKALRPRRGRPARPDLSRTCPAPRRPVSKSLIGNEKMVEAGGIEPPSA